MGVVYEALDHQNGRHVALKTMRAPSGEALLRFKNEFRALADIQHPNLVSLGELMMEAGQWCFTMELVRGINLLAYVRPTSHATARADAEIAGALDPTCDALDQNGGADLPNRATELRPVGPHAVHLDRLRLTLSQLAEGLHALHRANKVHRDVKPENVLVTEDGRVVILDFGLVGERRDIDSAIVGTIAYMAPEQAVGVAVGPAADWYSVGALLYEALTGRCPFEGPAMQVLLDKQQRVPPAPKSLCAGIPEDLDSLCMDLLRCDSNQRPAYSEILSRLQQQTSAVTAAADSVSSTAAAPFVGRQEQEDELERIYQRARAGHGQTVLLHGESGVGKSALMRHFAERLTKGTRDLIVLAGRCYEREMVPYKAVDGVIDSLSRYLRRLPEEQAAALLPRRTALLLQAFPVLTRVPALANAATTPNALAQASDPQERRERVFAALRELLTRLAERKPLLLLIDDLQWTDADSLALLSDLMNPPDEPPLLLVATVRSNAEVLNKTWMDPKHGRRNVHHLQVDRLGDADALALAHTLFAQSEVTKQLSAEHVAKEAAGHPLFIDELVRYTAATGSSAPVRLEDALWSRIQTLPKPARLLLQLSAVMGSPLGLNVATVASTLSADELDRSLAQLRGQRLLRATVNAHEQVVDTGGPEAVEPYHDRIREITLQRLLPDERRRCHLQLANALEQIGHQNPETLVLHCQGAGLREKAGQYALRAAEKATGALAFERAVKFYKQAIEFLKPAGADRRELMEKLGDSLIHANCSFEGAEALAEAAQGAPAHQASLLRRRAGDHYMRAGHFKQGMALCREAFRDLNLSFHTSTLVRLLYLAICRLWLTIRGLHFRERAENEIPAEQLARLDLLHGCVNSIGAYDAIFGIYCAARGLLMAIRTGEAHRISTWLMREAVSVSIGGSISAWQKGQRILTTAQDLMERTANPYASAFLVQIDGSRHYCSGQWRRASELFDQSEQIYLERCSGVSSELGSVRMMALANAYFLGDLRRLSTQLPKYMGDAEANSDLRLMVILGSTSLPVLHLVHDDAESSRREAAQYINKFTYPGDGVPRINVHWWAVQSFLYEGMIGLAYRQMITGLSRSNKMIITTVQALRIIDTELRGRCALAAVQETPSLRQRLLAEARRSIRLLEREQRPSADALARLLRAGLAFVEGHHEATRAQLQHAAEACERADMKLHAAVARRRLGQLAGEDSEHSAIVAAEKILSDEGVVNPARWVRMLTPFFPDA